MSEDRDTEWSGPCRGPTTSLRPTGRRRRVASCSSSAVPACGHRQFYPRALCTVCGADPEWERASGRGTVHTFTVIRQNYAKPFRDELPYVVAMIELAEGPMMMSNVTDCAADDVHVGMPVEAHFVTADDEIGVPFFRPA